MGKPLSEAPVVSLSLQELGTYEAQALLTWQVRQYSPLLLRWTIPSSRWVGHKGVLLTGSEANRFVIYTCRKYLSNQPGCNPSVGKRIGTGQHKVDPPEHPIHRKLWNPAFTRSYIENSSPSIQHMLAGHTVSWIERDALSHLSSRRVHPDRSYPGVQVDHASGGAASLPWYQRRHYRNHVARCACAPLVSSGTCERSASPTEWHDHSQRNPHAGHPGSVQRARCAQRLSCIVVVHTWRSIFQHKGDF